MCGQPFVRDICALFSDPSCRRAWYAFFFSLLGKIIIYIVIVFFFTYSGCTLNFLTEERLMTSKDNTATPQFTRRDMLMLIGQAAGGVAMYQAMTGLGFAAESPYKGPMRLEGKPGKDTSVLILGAGVAGMVAAYELRKAGYKVKVLEYREKAGGRCWTLRGGDTYTELGGTAQKCDFAPGGYLNPGPWRIPYHHFGILDYCRELKVPIEVFSVVNYNAYVHSKAAFGGKPQRFRHASIDLQGYVAELLAKAAAQGNIDAAFTKEDLEKLRDTMKDWGGLNESFQYVKGRDSSVRRGYDVDPAGGLMPPIEFSQPLDFKELIRSGFARPMTTGQQYEYQSTMFQPVGGMDGIAKAFGKELEGVISYNMRVSKIAQDEKGVTVTYTNMKDKSTKEIKADWCVCTIPLSILSQLDVQVGTPMKAAINAVPYAESFKAGVQFKRRFWEEDERIFGGITYTDLPIDRISYPSGGLNTGGKGVLQACYTFGPAAYKFSALPPEERLAKVLEYGTMIHPQYPKEFDGGISVGWHRVPWTNGCYGLWTEESRAEHYKNLCAIDGRIVLAGEHASFIPAWLEGAVLSSMDAVERLHKRINT